MKNIVRLSESDLVRLVKKVIKEQSSNEVEESAFTFGDKVKGKLGRIIGIPEKTDDEKRLAEDILDKVESGDFELIKSGVPTIIKVNLSGEDFIVKLYERMNLDGLKSLDTYVKTKDGHELEFPSGFGYKLLKLVRKNNEKPKFKYPRN